MNVEQRNWFYHRAMANGWHYGDVLAAWLDAMGDLWDELVFMAYYPPKAGAA